MERTRLVLTRKPGQSLWIGDTKVTLEKNGKVVIEAPPEVNVRRDELEKAA